MVATFFPQCSPQKGRPSAWTSALLFISYMLLIPGIMTPLFSLNLVVTIQGMRFGFKSDENGNAVGWAESFYGVQGELREMGCIIALLFLLLYAVIIPSLKLILLGIGEY